jgi:hypothetical protein
MDTDRGLTYRRALQDFNGARGKAALEEVLARQPARPIWMKQNVEVWQSRAFGLYL